MSKQATWKRRVAEWRASGLTAAEFAAGRDFAPATLSWWAWRLGSVAAPAARSSDELGAVGFVRAVAAEAVPSAVETPVVVELGEARVRVWRGFDRGVLEAVISVLTSQRGRGA